MRSNEPGALALGRRSHPTWDNRLVQHYGVPDHTTDRYLERITVEGGPMLSIAYWQARGAEVTAPV